MSRKDNCKIMDHLPDCSKCSFLNVTPDNKFKCSSMTMAEWDNSSLDTIQKLFTFMQKEHILREFKNGVLV